MSDEQLPTVLPSGAEAAKNELKNIPNCKFRSLTDFQIRINDQLDIFWKGRHWHAIKKNERGSFEDLTSFVTDFLNSNQGNQEKTITTRSVNFEEEKTNEQKKMDLIRRTVAKDLTPDEFMLFMYIAKKTGLNPLTKQVYAVKRYDKKTNSQIMTIQYSIDGYRFLAEQSGKYEGQTRTTYSPDLIDNKYPTWAEVGVYKKGSKEPTFGRAYWNELKPPTGQDFMWNKMPHHMLGNAAERLALRKAFPATYTDASENEDDIDSNEK